MVHDKIQSWEAAKPLYRISKQNPTKMDGHNFYPEMSFQFGKKKKKSPSLSSSPISHPAGCRFTLKENQNYSFEKKEEKSFGVNATLCQYPSRKVESVPGLFNSLETI